MRAILHYNIWCGGIRLSGPGSPAYLRFSLSWIDFLLGWDHISALPCLVCCSQSVKDPFACRLGFPFGKRVQRYALLSYWQNFSGTFLRLKAILNECGQNIGEWVCEYGVMRAARGKSWGGWMCMEHGAGLGAHPERIPKASRSNGGRGNYKTTRKEDEMKVCKHIPMKETTIHNLGLISHTTDRAIIYI